MVLGLIGGVLALIVGAIGFAATSTLGSWASAVSFDEGAEQMRFYSTLSILLPILGLVGAGLSGRSALLAAGLMGVSAAGMLYVFGIGVFSIICGGLLGVGALLILTDKTGGHSVPRS
ncbi:MAG: hypothetical protein JNN02_04075 [Tabrizicola sp.]|nr:hypothetical protein [Tabrizicola sp.]